MDAILPVEVVEPLLAHGVLIPFAKKPLPSTWSIVNEIGGRKIVGFVQVGGTPEQFAHYAEQHRAFCKVHGWESGPHIHAQSGSIDKVWYGGEGTHPAYQPVI